MSNQAEQLQGEIDSLFEEINRMEENTDEDNDYIRRLRKNLKKKQLILFD